MPRYPDVAAPFWRYINDIRYGLVTPDNPHDGYGDFSSADGAKKAIKALREHGLHPRIYKMPRNSLYDERWYIYVPDDKKGRIELRKAEDLMMSQNLWKWKD